MVKRFGLIFTLAALATSVASADILPFSWSTSGSGLSSTPLTFNGVSAGAPVYTDVSGNLLGISLGTISFPDIDTNYNGTFGLTVTFLRPDGLGDQPYIAPFTLTAEIVGNHNDLLTLDFPEASSLSFSGTDGAGSFMFGIPDITFTRTGNGQTRTVELKGDITGATGSGLTAQVAAVPEPGSILLLGTALGGLALTLRRRKRG